MASVVPEIETADDAIAHLRSIADPDARAGMARFGINTDTALGLSIPDLRRTGFALIAALAVHDKPAGDDRFLALLPKIEAAAADDRNFVKKAVNWALRQIGKRNAALNRAAIACAEGLIARPERSARWIGRDALRELSSDKVQRRLKG